MIELLAVMAGGAAGALLRHLISGAVNRVSGRLFPWGTLAVNVLGAVAIGLLAAFAAGGQGGDSLLWLLLGVGVLGSLTTVSSWALQTLYLQQEGRSRAALLNVLGTVVLCFLAVVLGYLAGMGMSNAG